MMDLASIENLDCQKIAEDVSQRKNLLHGVRALFAEASAVGWERDASDADLFLFALAKYRCKPVSDPELVKIAAADFEAWTLRARVPYYICSYYKERLRKLHLVVA